ncbi:hypothetical protein [Sphingobacterium sp.]|uniref:hypothetical protein n=1 Tax=Sphingobacterium sp. TaxID=341027 RepID=UPI002896B548|nr:hypothetical protein [Sphingobacterium sp.]
MIRKYRSTSGFIKLLVFISIILMKKNSMAQQITHYLPNDKDRAKKISGQYGDNSGICLFEDGKFMLFGYATLVFGSYVFEKDYLLFYPDEIPLFQLYAYRNPRLTDSIRIDFIGFEQEKTFVQFENNSPNQVFNDKANCFSPPFIYQEPKIFQSLKFAALRQNVDQDTTYQVFQYTNEGKFNDFLAIYNKPQRARQNFSAYLYLAEDKKLAIRLSNYGGEKGFLRENQADPTQEYWSEKLHMKQEYERAGAIEPLEIYCNPHYTIFYPDLSEYVLDSVKQQYIITSAKDNEDYFTENPTQDDRYLMKYTRQNLRYKQPNSFDVSKRSDTSLFFSSCEEHEKSYKYRKGRIH